MTDDLKADAIALYDRFTHGVLERREFMARMVALTGSVAAANALIGTIAARADAAPLVAETDRRLTTRTQEVAGYKTYVAEPRTRSLKATVLVIHENRGLNAHTRDVARRLALANFRAVAPDFLTPAGGTPANEDQARDMIGKLDLAQAAAGGVAMLKALEGSSRGGKVGAVGFCWGGGMVNRLAVAAGSVLDAGVVYYGPAPAPAEAARVEAPLADPSRRPRHPHRGDRIPVDQRASRRRQAGHLFRLSGRQPRLQQRHLGRTLRQGRRGSRLGPHLALLPPPPWLGRSGSTGASAGRRTAATAVMSRASSRGNLAGRTFR